MNLKIASAVVNGHLDRNAFCQGLLAKCVSTLEKQRRGIHTQRGRTASLNEAEDRLIQDAALSLALAGGNSSLAKSLGQNVSCPRFSPEDLPTKFSLPNPMLALMDKEQLLLNIDLVDKLFARSPSAPQRRLILAIDHTYLQRVMVQMKWQGRAGLIGRPWKPDTPDDAFIPLDNIPPGCLKQKKASLMLECLVWDPVAANRQAYSLASMPMSLERSKQKQMTLTKQGNLEAQPWYQ